MISVRRDPKPPFPHDRKVKWWRWDASVKTPFGHTPEMHGWTSGSKETARTAAETAEKKLHGVHVAKVRMIGAQELWFDRPRPGRKPKAATQAATASEGEP